MLAGHVIRVASDATLHFRGTCAQNAMITETLDMKPLGLGAGGVCRARLRSLVIISVQNLAWGLYFWGSRTFQPPPVLAVPTPQALNLDTFRGFWEFGATDAKQIAGTGQYYYYIDGLDIPYADADQGPGTGPWNPAIMGFLHVGLVNRSASAKTAGDAGALVIHCGFEPTLGGA